MKTLYDCKIQAAFVTEAHQRQANKRSYISMFGELPELCKKFNLVDVEIKFTERNYQTVDSFRKLMEGFKCIDDANTEASSLTSTYKAWKYNFFYSLLFGWFQ
ncbi:uncharacterized protein LOC136033119 [Artemia franciscana]|uniref:uncharacterized protein LOC136033119 n=1 Tax=Artemia franciscana TaxID=6661 RepID=UPI0032DB6E3A